MSLCLSRSLGMAAGLALFAVPLMAWGQAVPAEPTAPATASVDSQAKVILDQTVAAHKALNALSATIAVETTGAGDNQSQTVTLAFQKPGMAKAAIADKTGAVAQIVSDGKMLAIYDVHAKQYVKELLPSGTSAIVAVLGSARTILPMMMSRPDDLPQNFAGNGIKTVLSTDTVRGVAVDVVTVILPVTTGRPVVTLALSIGHDDHLLRQMSESFSSVRDGKPQTVTHTETVTDLSTTPALTAADFAFTPPPGAKKVASLEPPMHDPHLVPGARPFPIATKDIVGQPISLAQYRGKVVLMDFWATWCGPCVGEMPNVIAAYKTYHAQGFDVLGISLNQDKSALTAFIRQNKMPWRQVFDGKGWKSAVPRQYGVNSIPFGLLIGRDGKIVGVEVRGPDLAPAIRRALAKKQASAQ